MKKLSFYLFVIVFYFFILSIKPVYSQLPQADFSCEVITVDSLSYEIQFINNSSNATTYEWDFGDGSPVSTDSDPSHEFSTSYPNVDNYLVTLVANNASGNDTAYRMVGHYDNAYGCFNMELTADYNYTCVGDGEIDFTNMSTGYVEDYEWNFGDGTPVSTDQNVNHSFSVWPGTYDVSLQVSNQLNSDVYQEQITIDEYGYCETAPFPVFGLYCDPSSPGLAMCNNLITNNYDWLLWDFGDGNTSTDVEPLHQYAVYPYHYNVCLTAGNNYGSNTYCMNLNIHANGYCDTLPPDPHNTISGYVYHDENLNCIKDNNEPGLPERIIMVEPGPLYAYTNSNGYYSIDVDTGTYEISALPADYWNAFCPSAPASHTEDFTTYYNVLTDVNFADTITDNCSDLWIDVSMYPKICLDTSMMVYVSYGNSGTESQQNATIEVTFPPEPVISSASTAWDNQTNQTFTWEVGEIAPYEEGYISVYADFCDPLYVDSLCCVNAEISPITGDCNATDNSVTDCHQYLAASDPNDKQAASLDIQQNGYVKEENIEDSDSLTFLIHFQNVGTAPATHVRIEDSIDPALDITSIQLSGESHPLSMFDIEDGNKAVWRFTNINLPDSAENEAESHGFVKYKINQTAGNTEGTEIYNSADIYFDLLPAVITDTTIHTIVDDISVIASELEMDMDVFPNPAGEMVYIQINEDISNLKVDVFNPSGQRINTETISGKKSFSVPLTGASGIYLFRFSTNDNRNGTVKVLKQ
ncbi:MAG: DUF7619 domain-containing protein [Bacteroidota bacterium]